MVGTASAVLHRRDVLGAGLGLALTATTSSAFAQLAPPKTRLLGFVVGIDRYANIKPLERAVADARAVAAAIGGFGYEVISAIDGDTNLLLDRFAEFRGKLGQGDASFIYYAGHGIQVRQTNFLLPADVDPTTSDSLLETSVQVDSLLADIAARRPSQSIVILDACRNDPLPLDVPGKADGYTSTNAPGGFFVSYSAGRGEYALDKLGDDDTNQNGLFARCLLDQLAPDVPIYDIVKAAGEDVILAARAIGHAQHPAVYDQTAKQVRLDAQPGPPRRKPRKTAGRLDGCVALLIGLQRYGEYSALSSLFTPYSDCARIERELAARGASVTTLLDPTREQVEAACKALVAADHTKRFVFYSGMGGLIDRESFLIIRSNDAVYGSEAGAESRGVLLGQSSPKMAVGATGTIGTPAQPADNATAAATDRQSEYLRGLDFMTATELADALANPTGSDRDAAVSRGVAISKSTRGPSRWQRDTFIMIDTDFADLGIDSEKRNDAESILDKPFSNPDADDWGENIDGLALLFAVSPMQHMLDVAPGKQSSAFVIALCNALGRPGATLEQLADAVRSEVEVLTDRFQTPLLLANRFTRNRVLVDLAL
ncbi:caspase family protein [Blastomonas sp.]|uniref:caspase family protein n=1 Tax=Blastomonas sp. TaxID=1909299 RepID=UPI0035945A60